MTLQTTLKQLYEPFLVLALQNCRVSHYRRASKPPFVVWAEDGEDNSFHSGNHKSEQQLTGVVDFYTLKEFDTLADDIQDILNNEPVGWRLDSVQYEDEANLIHYQWRWWVSG